MATGDGVTGGVISPIQKDNRIIVAGNNNTVNDSKVILSLLDVISKQASTINELQGRLFALQMQLTKEQ